MKVITLNLTSIVFLFAISAFAEHREHGAHVHGTATLNIAFDGLKGKAEFKGAAEGILGFEHKANSAKDKKTLADSLNHFEKNISKMIQFDAALNCQFAKEQLGQVPEKGEKDLNKHSDWSAVFNVTCAKSIIGTKLVVDFSSFKRLNDLDVTVLVGDLQKTVEAKKKSVSIDLNQ